MGGKKPRGRRDRYLKGIGRLGSASCIVAALVTLAPLARAEAARVALVHDEHPDALELRTLTRLRAELAAAGFEVTEIARTKGDGREAAEVEPPLAGVFATIAIAPRSADAADVWVSDRITGKTLMRRVESRSERGTDVAAVLAVRAVELLQASLLEAVESRRGDASTAPPVPARVSEGVAGKHPP